jgi:hypothetical protein
MPKTALVSTAPKGVSDYIIAYSRKRLATLLLLLSREFCFICFRDRKEIESGLVMECLCKFFCLSVSRRKK